MGCDIHLHVEVKIEDEWHHYAQLNPSRHYTMFARMASVRNGNDVTPIAEPRGYPPDPTRLTMLDAEHWGSDGHSASWLNAVEIAALSKWGKCNASKVWRGLSDHFDMEDWLGIYLYSNSFAGLTNHPDEYPALLQDLRFIFWFDN